MQRDVKDLWTLHIDKNISYTTSHGHNTNVSIEITVEPNFQRIVWPETAPEMASFASKVTHARH